MLVIRTKCSIDPLQTQVKQILNKKGGYEMSELMKRNFNRLQNLKLVTLCVVQGVAIGGGAELLTACDFRLATRSSKIGFVHKKLAITTGALDRRNLSEGSNWPLF